MEDISLVYYGYVFDASGYGHAARGYIHALHAAGVRLSVVDLAGRGAQVRDDLIESLVRREADADFHLFHGIPPQWSKRAFGLPNAIGMTVWETDEMPSQWRNALNHTLEIWLPCEFNVATFSRALEKPVFKLPHPIFPSRWNGSGTTRGPEAEPPSGISENDFVYYCVIEWQERKNPEGTIDAYLRAFPGGGDALLFIKTNAGAESAAREALENARNRVQSQARVEICAEAWDEARIEALHARGDCYVSLHRGEGWCYPLFEAASRGKPVISTSYSGPLDYLDSESHLLVRYASARVGQRYVYYNHRMNWAEPDLEHARQLIEWAYDNRDVARAQAVAAAPRIQQAYSLESVGRMAKARLISMLQRRDPQKWSRLARRERASELSPAIPIPPEWYDEDYFENGLKSNWSGGYTWPQFTSLFLGTAQFLIDVFPDAATYLDVGCGKGFLIRALRERERECWGFDHSAWAVEHAEESIKPFLINTGVDDASFDRRFDLLLAFSVFETLTESQARSFLSRAREWTNHALLAVIPSVDSEEERRSCEANDRDLSHITMRSRAWWHELFLEAGWRQDHMGRIVERLCQNHSLPGKMGWKVFVYAPD